MYPLFVAVFFIVRGNRLKMRLGHAALSGRQTKLTFGKKRGV